MKKRIIIEMEGGLIQNVVTNFGPGNLEVLLVDHDTEGDAEENLRTVPAVTDQVYLQGYEPHKNTPWVEEVFRVFNTPKEG